jgi:hypothetical protein
MDKQNGANTLRKRLAAFFSRHWAEEKRMLKIHIEDMKYKGQHVVALLFITIFCFIVIRGEYNFCELDKYGKTTKAVIVCFHEYTKPMGRRVRTNNYAIYEYYVDGIAHADKILAEEYKLNDSIVIRYLPKKPEENCLQEKVDEIPDWEMAIFEFFN